MRKNFPEMRFFAYNGLAVKEDVSPLAARPGVGGRRPAAGAQAAQLLQPADADGPGRGQTSRWRAAPHHAGT